MIRQKLLDVRSLSLSVDSWTSLAQEIFIAITAHGITSDWVLEGFLLTASPVYQHETGVHIADTIEETPVEWGLSKEKVVGITSDGAANVRNTIQVVLKVVWLYCADHVTNRSIRLGLDSASVKPLIDKSKKISRFFKSSPKATRLLTQKLKAFHLPMSDLKTDNKTRWGSAYDTMDRLCKSRSAVSACLALRWNTRRKVPKELTPTEWSSLDEMRKVLAPLKEGSEFLAQQKHPAVGLMWPIIYRMLHHHLNASVEQKERNDRVVDLFKTAVADDLSQRWGTVLSSPKEILLLSVFLDPPA